MRRRGARALAAALAATLLVACGSSNDPTAASADPADGRIAVVTSTTVWADVAREVGGDRVAVTPVITDPAVDPHSFEPNAQAQLAVSKAQLLVQNGGGYDDWMTQMAQASGSIAPVIDVVALTAHADEPAVTGPAATDLAESDAAENGHEHTDGNEHVWYDVDAVQDAAAAIAAALAELEPAQARTFASRAGSFDGRLNELSAQVAAIRAAHAGAPVAVTEPVPLPLLLAAGLENRTPEDFSTAIEDGTDVPPAALEEMLQVVSGKHVELLVVNQQTSSSQTERVRSAAEAAGVPVVLVTEFPPPQEQYVPWMKSTIDAISTALG
jgi:zinc/manganese transport system substrate-binding protein